MEDDLSVIVQEVNRLIPQLGMFISQFKSIVIETGINVVSDSQGNLSIDVPSSMSDSDANKVSARIGVIDRLITHNGMSINDMFNKGLSIENALKGKDPSYNSQLTNHILQFKALNASYKH
jgi:hypothetical protein